MQNYKLVPDVPGQLIRGDELDYMRVVAFCRAIRGNPYMVGKYGLLSVGKDPKTVKGEKYGVRTGVLYLAPAQISGHEICPSRTKGCSAACLYTAGHGAYANVQLSRVSKTMAFHYDRERFMKQLDNDILVLQDDAAKKGMVPAVRLNGTSDINWTEVDLFDHNYRRIFDVHPDTNFYDYTKRLDVVNASLEIPNYHITFSRAETKKNHRDCEVALELGVNITAVFRKNLPATYLGFPVINGDESDVRFWDTVKGGGDGPVVIGLKAKGRARYDKTGFVID